MKPINPVVRSFGRFKWLMLYIAIASSMSVLISRGLRHSCLDLGLMTRFPFGTVSYVPCVPAFVVNHSGNLVVFPGLDPDNKPLSWDSIRRLFHSPSWNEVFDPQGRRIRGVGGDLVPCVTNVEEGRLKLVSLSACRQSVP